MSKHVLIIDDDPHIRDVIRFALENAGFQTTSCGDGVAGMTAFHRRQPTLIVLDVGMPEMDGLEVCREIRKTSDCPILFLSARDEEIDRVLGLEMGGDDYVTKPFSPRELVARVNTILRRIDRRNGRDEEPVILLHGMLMLEPARRRLMAGSVPVELTGTEFEILHLLMRRPGVVYSRAEILDHAYPDNIHVSDRTIDSHVRNLRGKLRDGGCADAIRTVHGLGFQLDACEGGV